MLAIGIIQESNSAWSSPTILVKKKDGTMRFCIDYRRLNQVMKVDAYPLQHIEDSLNTLGGERFFCSLDLASGYWQVEMDATDQEKTAFVAQGGLFEFRVMPFRLVNTPPTFEGLMERVLRGIAWSECLVYLDHILVFGPDFETTLAKQIGVGVGSSPDPGRWEGRLNQCLGYIGSRPQNKLGRDDAAVPATRAGLSYLLLKFSHVRMSALDQSSMTVLLLTAGVPSPATAQCTGSDPTGG